uniref:P2 n=1 Tax=Grapevine associated jivivirus 2 TaxID=2716189 RepID=A0A6G7M512_9VIRU|nr:P2 [Grapevine associated jivivirus 2]
MDVQDLFLIEKAGTPNSDLFRELKALLISDAGDDPKRKLKERSNDWKIVLPFRGWGAEMDEVSRRYPDISFEPKGVFRNAVASMAVVMAHILEAVNLNSKPARVSRSICFSALADELSYVASKDSSDVFDFYSGNSVYDVFKTTGTYETAFFDHTSICAPIDRFLNICYGKGIQMVEGCFYYHPAAERGWDLEFSWTKLSVLHDNGEVNIGPKDDASRRMTYTAGQYRAFLDPSVWVGNAKQYGYELYSYGDGIMCYRAIFIGSVSPERLFFNLPMSSDPDNVLITVNKKFLDNSFVPEGMYDMLSNVHERDYAIEVRRNVVDSCIAYLLTLSPNADLTGNAIRHVTARNYIDLAEGTKLIRMSALSYSDALIVALVCALSAYQLRYQLTTDSVSIIQKAISTSRYTVDSEMGLIGQVFYCLQNFIADKTIGYVAKSVKGVLERLNSTDYIPGVVYDIYYERSYEVGSVFHQQEDLVPEIPFLEMFDDLPTEDPFISFVSNDVRASAPELRVVDMDEVTFPLETKLDHHVPRQVDDVVSALQEVYDTALPGHSTLDVQNVSEQRRTNDININAEFVGAISSGKDVIANENLYKPTPVRTAALPQTRTSLIDLTLASSKRNWNKPDLQMVTDVYNMAETYVDEFIENAMVPHAKQILASREADPLRFNALDYCAWLSTRSGSFKDALLASCPNELLSLNLEKYQTILKGRIKQKQTPAAQHELPQGQVVIHHDPSTNALFTSVFRKMFEVFDAVLLPQYKSAGRISDSDLSKWFTKHMHLFRSSKLVEIDSSKYDKSQGILAQAIEAVMMRRLGLDMEILDTFAESFVGNVNSRNLGLAFVIAFQRKSGAADTMFGNLIYNFISAGRSIGYNRITFMVGKGDDNVVGVVDIDPGMASSKMSNIFNLDAKVLLDQVPAFSSGYIVPLEDVVLFAPDPIKKLELLGEINARSGNSHFKLTDEERFERYVSFRDSVSMYDVAGLPSILNTMVRLRMSAPEVDIELLIDALMLIAKDFSLFSKVVPY